MNNQTTLNHTNYDYRGTGYTRAFITVDRLQDDKFIAYIPTKDEHIVATKFANGAYGWTKYAVNMQDLEDLLKELYPMQWQALLLEHYNTMLEIELDYKTELMTQKRGA